MFELIVYDRDRDGNPTNRRHYATSSGERLEVCYRNHLGKQPDPREKGGAK